MHPSNNIFCAFFHSNIVLLSLKVCFLHQLQDSDRILGATILASNADEMIAELTVAA